MAYHKGISKIYPKNGWNVLFTQGEVQEVVKKKKKSVFALDIQPLDLCVEFNAEGGTSDVSTSIVTFFMCQRLL